MLLKRALYREIVQNDESFALFCSIAASGEAQGGWENTKIAELLPASCKDLAPKVARHGADEYKHARIFNALLRKRGLAVVPVPRETNYTMLLEGIGIGLAHDQLQRNERLTEYDNIMYLAHSRVTEQRAAEQMRDLVTYVGDEPEIGRAVKMISEDEANHLAYCHEELLRLASAGHARVIQTALQEAARAEIRIYRDVSRAVMGHMGRVLGWPGGKNATLSVGIQAMYAYERSGGWRRLTTLRMPERQNALGGPPRSEPEYG